MINKLKRKIILIITISLSVIIVGITVFYSVSTYRETINSSGFMIDRFMGGRREIDENFDGEMGEKPADQTDIPIKQNDINIDGVYRIMLDENQKAQNTDGIDSSVIEYAEAAAQKSAENGIVGSYIFRKMSIKGNENINEITLIESSETINRLNRNIIITVVIGVFAIALVYLIAKRITKQIVKPVEETLDMQKRFISDASHELKTPLAVIEANTGVLESEVGESKWTGYIHNEIESMNKLVNDLLLLAKTEGTDIQNISDFNLSQTVEIISAGFEGLAFENSVTLDYQIESDLSFKGDKEDIKHILSTLIDNAIKHSEKNSSVTVSLLKEKSDYIIKVKNKGEPIPKEDREHIFDRFYRVDKVRNREEKRYGLGLAIAQQAAEKYKGNITVDCKDGFTEFTVNLYSKA